MRHGAQIAEITGLLNPTVLAAYLQGTRVPTGHTPASRTESLRKNTGFRGFPSRLFAINAARLELALTGIDLLAGPRCCC